MTRKLMGGGLRATFSCHTDILEIIQRHHTQGILYIMNSNGSSMENVKPEHFSHWYKWLVIGNEVPESMHHIRYDADVALLRPPKFGVIDEGTSNQPFIFEDVYVHPRDGVSYNSWAYWEENTGFQLKHERERILRRFNFKRYPMKIAAPVGHYSPETYEGTLAEYAQDLRFPEQDPGLRSAYGASNLILQAINATEIIHKALYFGAEHNNQSVLQIMATNTADISGGILRLVPHRLSKLDYIMTIWPFGVGFVYVAERKSSSNMFIEPFTPAVWWTCLGTVVILALAQRLAAKKPMEKEGAFMSVLATWLQQDASAIPSAASGKSTFMVMSVSAMLVHAYYTSAIVSALMSTGIGGPQSLRALADSNYEVVVENYYDIKNLILIDVKRITKDMDYLEKKKLTSKNAFSDMETGMKLVEKGNTAFAAQYNHINVYVKKFPDDKICKLQYINAIPMDLSWVTAPKHSQYSQVFRTTGAWLHEMGLAHRLVSRILIIPPPCRASMIAEKVKFLDIAPAMGVIAVASVASVTLLGLEILFAKKTGKMKRAVSGSSIVTFVQELE